jgi:hypothetical protein
MKYRLVVILLFALSVTASAGFLDKVAGVAKIATDVASAAITTEVEVEDQSISKEDFMARAGLSDEEYQQWH